MSYFGLCKVVVFFFILIVKEVTIAFKNINKGDRFCGVLPDNFQ